MPIYHSDDLDELAQKKCEEGCRAQLRGMARKVVVTGSADDVIKCWMDANDMGVVKDDVDMTLVKINQALLFMTGSCRSVRDSIESAVIPAAPSTSSKVLIKSTVRHIRKLVNSYDYWNKVSAGRNDTTLAINGNTFSPTYSVPDEIRTIKALRGVIEVIRRDRRFKSVSMKSWAPALEFVQKHGFNLTDEHVSAAWDIITAGQVHAA